MLIRVIEIHEILSTCLNLFVVLTQISQPRDRRVLNTGYTKSKVAIIS
jgi:hypothetical protein